MKNLKNTLFEEIDRVENFILPEEEIQEGEEIIGEMTSYEKALFTLMSKDQNNLKKNYFAHLLEGSINYRFYDREFLGIGIRKGGKIVTFPTSADF